MYALAIDPGKWTLACSYWHLISGRLWFAELIGKKPKSTAVETWHPSMCTEILAERAAEIGVSIAVCERPKPYQMQHQKGSQFDLHDLSMVCGAVDAALFATIGVHPRMPFPSDWKGNIPKHVSAMRVKAALLTEEWERVQWPIPSLRHNVVDALHLGLRTFTNRKT